MDRTNAWCGLILLSALLLGCSASVESPRTPDPLFGLGDREVFAIEAETIGRPFHILVRLPRSYDESDRDYPLVLLLDGGILFPMLVPFQLMMEEERTAGEAIVVGISYGGLGYANGNFRNTDFTAPSADVDYFGGAEAFQDFLADELLPRLEAAYRIDTDRTMLLGQSLGGQFAIHAALTRPELFSDYIAVNPALHMNLPYFLELEATPEDSSATLIVAIGTEDAPRYREAALAWLAARQPELERSLSLEVIPLPGGHHATSAPDAYFEVLRRRVPSSRD